MAAIYPMKLRKAILQGCRAQLREDGKIFVGLVGIGPRESNAWSDKKLEMAAEGEQKHVMLSYQWDKQVTVKRINESLIRRGYVTWFDLTNMKGSTMDAMR